MTDMSAARLFMVEGQVRTNDVTDKRITDIMGRVERELFVPTAKRALAYADTCVEVAAGRYLLDPRCFAKLVQLAEIGESERVLDVACATGYSTAVLCGLSGDVVALEEDEELAKFAAPLLRSCPKLGRLYGVVGPLKDDAPAQAPFDVIFVNGAVEEIPKTWVEQLKEGGRLVTCPGDRFTPVMSPRSLLPFLARRSIRSSASRKARNSATRRSIWVPACLAVVRERVTTVAESQAATLSCRR